MRSPESKVSHAAPAIRKHTPFPTHLIKLIALGLLTVTLGDHPDKKDTPDIPLHVSFIDTGMREDDMTEVNFEFIKADIDREVKNFIEQCECGDAFAFMRLCSFQDITLEDLNAVALGINPKARASLHNTAEILEQYPEVAPHVLESLRKQLTDLPPDDLKRLAVYVTPKNIPELSRVGHVKLVAERFLQEQQKANVYKPKNKPKLLAKN